jgi:hypothetical protein
MALTAVAVLAVAVACGSGEEQARNGDSGSNSAVSDLPVVDVPARWASGNARDLPTLIASTGTVFVGEVVALSGQRTQTVGRGAATAEGPSADFPISEYQVTVRRSLAGGLAEGTSVTLEQPGGVTTGADGSQARIMLEDDEPLEVGQTYLIFGSLGEDGVLTTAPYGRFVVENGSISPLDGWAQLPVAEQLAGRSVEDAAAQVENARP